VGTIIRCGRTKSDGTKCLNHVSEVGQCCQRCKPPEVKGADRSSGAVPTAKVAKLAELATHLGTEPEVEDDWLVDLSFAQGTALASAMEDRVQALRRSRLGN
jgi:hypothetical protein